MPNYRNDIRSSEPEQWEVVDHLDCRLAGSLCRYTIVIVKSNRGTLRRALKCFDCGDLELVSDRQWAAHGQRVERARY